MDKLTTAIQNDFRNIRSNASIQAAIISHPRQRELNNARLNANCQIEKQLIRN